MEVCKNIKKGIIFDIDGTLWDALSQITDAWNYIIREDGRLHKHITLDEMRSYMGMTLENIGRKMFDGEDEKIISEVIDKCAEYELEYLKKHKGTLYKDLETTLKTLYEDYELFIVSNCQEGYIEVLTKGNNLEKYFIDSECSGRTGKSKGENIKMIISRNHLDKAVYVGDTQLDLNAANEAGIPFIYAAYGFGNVDRHTLSINTFSDIIDKVKEVF